MKSIIPLMLLVATIGNVQANEKSSTAKAMAYFLNACWEGKFVGSEATDVHCFRKMVNGNFVRDNHLVTTAKGTNGGETVFWWDKEHSQLSYTYWDTYGGISNGTMRPTEQGFVSPDETYQMQDGSSMTIRTQWILHSDDEYLMESVKVGEDKTERMFAIEYKRVPLKACPGPPCDY